MSTHFLALVIFESVLSDRAFSPRQFHKQTRTGFGIQGFSTSTLGPFLAGPPIQYISSAPEFGRGSQREYSWVIGKGPEHCGSEREEQCHSDLRAWQSPGGRAQAP